MTSQREGNTTCRTSALKVSSDSGRVKVFVRIRPPRPQEDNESPAINVLECSSKVSDRKHCWEKTFNFDHVFPQESTNSEVCNTISKPLVNAALNGFNGTLMAYGQTGSGKTHTLMASDGIAAGVISRCFKRITQDDLHDYKVTMSYLQIYQERIYDLLNSPNKVELSLREHAVRGVFVENLSEYVVRSPSEVLNLLAVGKKRLVFAETKMNRNSSRSHSVCQLKIERTLNKNKSQVEGIGKDGVTEQGVHSRDADDEQDPATGCNNKFQDVVGEDSMAKVVAFDDDVLIRGQIYLCDLAGSERLKKTQAEGERLSEAQHINSSLLELGNVIQALAEGKRTHVPFRNSTLTRLLQESLGGNCKTSLVVCVSPTASDVSETKSALFFGSRAMKITNTAYVNVEVDYQRLSEDLSKIVNMREKDLIELRQSHETRMERVKHDAIAGAEKIVVSVKSLFDKEQLSLQNDLKTLQAKLVEEQDRSEKYRREATEVRRHLKRDTYRRRSVLLIDIISMQLLYAVKKLSLSQEGSWLPTITSTPAGNKILENTDVLLELFKSYLRLMNSKENESLDNGGSLRSLVEAGDSCEEHTILRDADDVSLYSTNETDDDKVEASPLRDDIQLAESRDDCPVFDEKLPSIGEYLELKDKLVSLKNCIDGEALEFLSKAFEFDPETKDQTLELRQDIYSRIKEVMDWKNYFSAENSYLEPIADTINLLDFCHSHVIVDKALQSVLLLLENTSMTRRFQDVSAQKGALEKENETLKKQVHSLLSEADNLSGRRTETSSMLGDVIKSKAQLEDDFLSVFQLYNTRDNGKREQEEKGVDCWRDCAISGRLQAEISKLMESNVKLKEELAGTVREKKTLENQLTACKEELKRETGKLQMLTAERRFQSIQAEETDNGDQSTRSHNQDVLQSFLSMLKDGCFALETAVLTAQANNTSDVSLLRVVFNQRLGKEWLLLALENTNINSELGNITRRITEETENIESQPTNLDFQKNENHGKICVDGRHDSAEQICKLFPKFEKTETDEVGAATTLEILIYDQNKIIFKLEMDKVELVKGLQPFKQDVFGKYGTNSEAENVRHQTTGDSCLVDRNSYMSEEKKLGNILKERLQEMLRVQQENQIIKEELAALRTKHSFLEEKYHDSSKSRERSEQKVTSLLEAEKQFFSKILEMEESCRKLEEKLDQTTTEKAELTEKLKEMRRNASEAEEERKRQKRVSEEILSQAAKHAERVLFLERTQKHACEERLREKIKALEEGKTLLRLKEIRISKMEEEFNNAQKKCELLQGSVGEFMVERENLTKEINGLRFMQGLPAINFKSNTGTNLLWNQTAFKCACAQKRQQNKQDNKLNCELTRAKEQLVRLKAELTFSNVQTKNLGSQLSSLREDSAKLEAELATVRISPTKRRPRRNSFSCYDETAQLEMELATAKRSIIELQEKLLCIYKEKLVLEETLMSCEAVMNKESIQMAGNGKMDDKETKKTAKEAPEMSVEDDAKEASDAQINEHEHEQPRGLDSEERKNFERRIDLLEEEQARLKKQLEDTTVEKSRLEGMECCVQELVTLEDETLRLQRRLKQWAKTVKNDRDLSATTETTRRTKQHESIFPLKAGTKTFNSDLLAEIKDLSSENYALQEEAESLKVKVVDLESALATLTFKMSVKDTALDSTSDKKALAMLLASVKQERAELQKALQDSLSEKDEVEKELAGIKGEYSRAQRELAMTCMLKDDLEVEVIALRNASMVDTHPSPIQSSNDCKGEISDSSAQNMPSFKRCGVSAESLCKAKPSAPLQKQKVVVVAKNRGTAWKEMARNTRNDNSPSSLVSQSKGRLGMKEDEKKALLPKQNNLYGSQVKGNKALGTRIRPSEPRRDRPWNGYPSQPLTDNTEHSVISFDLIRIDDVTDDSHNADTDCADSGLFRETPDGERENPEGMEGDELIINNANINSSHEIIETFTVNERFHPPRNVPESKLAQACAEEVHVRTTWSLKNLFRRQKSLALSVHQVAALKQ